MLNSIPLTKIAKPFVNLGTGIPENTNVIAYLVTSIDCLASVKFKNFPGTAELLQLATDRDFKGTKEGSSLQHRVTSGPHTYDIVLVSFGKTNETAQQEAQQQFSAYDVLKADGEERNCAVSAVSSFSAAKVGRVIGALALDQHKTAKNVTVVMEQEHARPELLEVLTSHICLWQQPDSRFKQLNKDDRKVAPVEGLNFVFSGPVADEKKMREALETGLIAACGAHLSRELVVAPPNYCNPETFAATIREQCAELGLQCRILEEEGCKERNMNAYLAVNAGSAFKPKLIHATYKTSVEVKRHIVFVGKGITMDTGGYNLKVGCGIETMKFDMGGAAAVFGAMKIIALTKPKNLRVDFIVAAAENMIDSKACRPGDIVTAANGKTIEILNTDAEGRLTLADALVYAQKECPDATAYVDVATLTGACLVGLGMELAGVYANNTGLMRALLDSGRRTGTPIWPMPLYSSYKSLNESTAADLSNLPSSRLGGSINAALFLQEFIEEGKNWAHMDVAGPVWDDKAKTATGYAAHLLADFAVANNV